MTFPGDDHNPAPGAMTMERNAIDSLVRKIMQEYAVSTGIIPSTTPPRRYLWTDAFAVCNYLEIYGDTREPKWLDLALRLVDRVHHTLGRYRPDDSRTGWISGLEDPEGEMHPTAGGLRIGKTSPERIRSERYDEQREWDRDGQYYHYLTKWMHALMRVSRRTGDPKHVMWGIELAKAVHPRFTYNLPASKEKRMYWKMSTDLTRPLVLSMGQHDPLDGYVTYLQLEGAAKDFGLLPEYDLSPEITDMAGICRGTGWVTEDPLGIGGLLFDATRVAQLIEKGFEQQEDLLIKIMDSALIGLESFVKLNPLHHSPHYRLPFREFGLSIGLKGWGKINESITRQPHLFPGINHRIDALAEYRILSESIEQFWLEDRNRDSAIWKEHQEINAVMLATSLAPEEFLTI